jgi:hypothetical protein
MAADADLDWSQMSHTPVTAGAKPRVPKPLRGVAWFVRDYASRHRHPGNRALHLVGVPLSPFGTLYLLAMGSLPLAAGSFASGYLLQWAGHRLEGNEVGEWILIKTIAGKLR